MESYSIKEVLKGGWETFWKRPWFFIGIVVTVFVISGISSAVFTPGNGGSGLFGPLGFIIDYIVGAFVAIGLTTVLLKADRALESVSFNDLWNPQPFISYFVATLLVSVIVVVGLILLIVPGVIAILALLFTPYLVVDKNMGPFDAMKESMRITKGNRLKLLGFVLALVGVNILGALALGVGLLISVPVSMLAFVRVYRLHTAPVPQVSEGVTA